MNKTKLTDEQDSALGKVAQQFAVWRDTRTKRERIPDSLWSGAVDLFHFSGYLFVFINRRRTAIKVLCYDTQGFRLCQKRLSTDRFKWWAKNKSSTCKPLDAHELQMLLWNGDPFNTGAAPAWRKLSA